MTFLKKFLTCLNTCVTLSKRGAMKYPYNPGEILVIVNNPDDYKENGKIGTVVSVSEHQMRFTIKGESSPGCYAITTFRYPTKLELALE